MINWIDYFMIKKSRLFDARYYLSKYPDVRYADVDPLIHFIKFGWKEGRNPSSEFETKLYLEKYPDVKNSGMNPLKHYIKFGVYEGRAKNYAELIDREINTLNEEYGYDEQETKYKSCYSQFINAASTKRDSEYVDDIEYSYINNPKIKPIAFYLPQFHPIPENDEWWGKGFTEWTNVSKAVPQFVGHYQPHLPGELGFYDLRVREVQRRQVELAKKYGIYGFCFYYYWFNGKRLLEKPIEQYINDSTIDFPFCLCWANENWTRRWDGESDQVLIGQEHTFEYDKKIIHEFVRYFVDPRYIRINNRPLIIVYRASILQDVKATVDYWRKYSTLCGAGNPYILVAQTFGYHDPRQDGFDGAVEFPPNNLLITPEISRRLTIYNNNFSGTVYSYSDFVNSMINRLDVEPFTHFKTVIPGWDNEPRRPGKGTSFIGSTPELYKKWLEATFRFILTTTQPNERFVFINAWNEWAEGAHLEPDRRFGYAYLKATSDALKAINDGKSSQTGLSKFKSVSIIAKRFENVINSWPKYMDFHSPPSANEISLSNQELSQIIDNFLSTNVVDSNTTPLVSIIIPVFNHIEDTLNCIKSIWDTHEKTPYEIIMIDDGSADDTYEIFSRCKTIRYFKNSENIGFLKSCNLAAQHALGSYLIFLNNDTIVMPDWIDRLIDTFTQNPDAGLVGSKLLYPDGRLQDAGGLMFEDATGTNYGRDDDPDKPQYNYLREADYCTGASICIPKFVWDELQGFDPIYSPAYYEDTDFAFRVRAHGYMVLYQPLSQVIHVEGVTSGTSIISGTKQYQEINRLTFYDRWKDVLKVHGTNAQEESYYRNRVRKSRVLVIDVCTPKPDQDSGSMDTYHYLLTLRELGFEVTFISVVDSQVVDRYVMDLQGRGIECIYSPYLRSIEEYLSVNGKYFKIVVLFRAPYGGKYIDNVKTHAPQAKIVFNTVDLHSLRETRETNVTHLDDAQQERISLADEMQIMKKAHETIVVSDYEYQYLAAKDRKLKVRVIPIPRSIPGRSSGFVGRKNIIYIGGFLHKPNIDAVKYYINEIWPLVMPQLPGCEFHVIGSNVPPELETLQSDTVKILGYVQNLTEVFSECKITVAPLRYGAGIKGKIVTSLSYGVPCVATKIASEGMGLTPGKNVLIGDNPTEFAVAVVKLYSDKTTWESISQNGLELVNERYSLDTFKKNLNELVDNLNVKPKLLDQ